MQPVPAPVTDFFTYSATFTTLALSTSQTQSIQIQANSHFEVRKLVFACFYGVGVADTNTTLAVPAVTVLITDTGSGRQWSDQPIQLTSMFGTGMLPAILPTPRIIPAASQLTIQVNNLFTGQNIALLALGFVGRKVYR
jgi:hypothetical protein